MNLAEVDKYDGSTRFDDWFFAFDNHVRLDDIMRDKLAASVISRTRGPAQTLSYNLPLAVKRDNDGLIDRLRERYDGHFMCEYGKWSQFKQAVMESVENFPARMESSYRPAE